MTTRCDGSRSRSFIAQKFYATSWFLFKALADPWCAQRPIKAPVLHQLYDAKGESGQKRASDFYFWPQKVLWKSNTPDQVQGTWSHSGPRNAALPPRLHLNASSALELPLSVNNPANSSRSGSLWGGESSRSLAKKVFQSFLVSSPRFWMVQQFESKSARK